MVFKKGQINQVFIYILSIIMVVFVGFLVGKFLLSFDDAVESRNEVKIFNDLSKDFETIYTNYGSEKTFDYRLTDNVKYVCFAQRISCVDNLDELNNDSKESFKILIEGGDNVVIFGNNDVINGNNIGNFKVKDGCSCIRVINKKLHIFMENRKNEVWISENIYT